MRLTGAQDGPFDIFSYAGLVLIVSMHLYFYTFTLTVSALDMISSELEDAANILGAGMVITAVKVTLPLAMPAILAA
ncbi:MAG: ABC transporter permease subunit [Acetobacteraceae bacterium]